MTFFPFYFKPISELALLLSQDFSKSLPPPHKFKSRKAPSTQKVDKAISALHSKARANKEIQKFGFLKRSLLTWHLQKEMQKAGYDADLVKKIIMSFISSVLIRR